MFQKEKWDNASKKLERRDGIGLYDVTRQKVLIIVQIVNFFQFE
jgi:hypothetical protein